MKFKEIQIKAFLDFIKSDLYQNSTNIPITEQRAISQFYNPRANKEAIALILAIDKTNQIVGFIGALPDYFAKHPSIQIAWNSCWWTDQKKGKQTALPLFLKFLKVWNNKVMFRDMTSKTFQVIKRLNKFEEVKALNGYRYFIRINSAEILPNKHKSFNLIKPLLSFSDMVINSLLTIKNINFKNDDSFIVNEINSFDKESIQFMNKQNTNELFKREETELNWILKQKWITKSSKIKPNQFYYFSDDGKFSNHLLKIHDHNKNIIALLFLTNNNGLVKVPYAYFDRKNVETVVKAINHFLKKHNAISFLTYNEYLNNYILKNNNPFWYKKQDNKVFFLSKNLVEYTNWEFDFQDGEGDFVFT